MSDVELSPEGEARRERILDAMLRQTRQRRRRRLALRAGVACAALAAIGVGVVQSFRSPPDRPVALPVQEPSPRVLFRQDTDTKSHWSFRLRRDPQPMVIEHIETDPTIASRLAIPPATPAWKEIDDDQLLKELAEAGMPAGLAHVDGQAILIFHSPPR